MPKIDFAFVVWFFRYGLMNWIIDRPRKIKTFFQRGRKGWAEEDTWNFDGYLSSVIMNGLKHLKSYYSGEQPTQKEFDIMIKGFEANLKMINADVEYGTEEFEECKREFEEGMKVFVKNFNNLWD